MAMTHSSNRISSRRVGSRRRGRGWFFFSSRSGDGDNKNKNTSLRRHRPLVSQRSFFWSMSAMLMLGLLTISTLHVNIKYIKYASRSSDAYTNNVMFCQQERSLRSLVPLVGAVRLSLLRCSHAYPLSIGHPGDPVAYCLQWIPRVYCHRPQAIGSSGATSYNRAPGHS